MNGWNVCPRHTYINPRGLIDVGAPWIAGSQHTRSVLLMEWAHSSKRSVHICLTISIICPGPMHHTHTFGKEPQLNNA